MGRFRYLLPNAVTATSIGFALLAVQSAVAGRSRTAAWWVLWCVLADKLDGAVARALKATSPFGLQLDSLADFLAFGVAPATILYAFFSRWVFFGWGEGVPLWILRAIMVGWVVAAAVRLARFNVIAQTPGAERFFFGVPTTFAGGFVMALFLALLKYGNPAVLIGDLPEGWDPRLLGDTCFPTAMRVMPIVTALGALSMVSTLRVPKIGRSRHLVVNIWVFGNVILAYGLGALRIVPEYLAFGALTFFVGSVVYHFTSAEARRIKLPPLFVDPPSPPPASPSASPRSELPPSARQALASGGEEKQ